MNEADRSKVKLQRAERKVRILEDMVENITRELYTSNQKNRELEQFAYIASHDLQEPLRTVTSCTEFIASGYSQHFDENALKSMNFITNATNRMSNLISGLLEYCRLGVERVLIPASCERILEDLRQDFAATIKETGAIIEIGELPKIMCYETEFRQLFQNLISNAIKFARKGEAPNISIFATQKDNFWEFAVKDNGIGMEQEHQERIFIIFQRLHLQNQYKGTGIGLALCQKIVELHGGKIWVESSPNQGSTFFFTIPS